MNIFNLLNRGAQHANIITRRTQAEAAARENAALEQARRDWLDALLVDETRAWLEIGETSRAVLSGLSTLLVLAGMAKTADAGTVDTPELRIIRGAISAAEQCGNGGSVITADTARALSAAAAQARAVLETCSLGAIRAAALGLRREVGLAGA